MYRFVDSTRQGAYPCLGEEFTTLGSRVWKYIVVAWEQVANDLRATVNTEIKVFVRFLILD